MTDRQFIIFYNQYFDADIDKLADVYSHRFNGIELKKFTEHVSKYQPGSDFKQMQKIKEMTDHLEWNISSIRNSPSSRESVITLKVYEELLLKLKAGGGI
jgi:hypothetical protein